MIDRQSLYGAVIDCPHTIEENRITLRFDSSKPGNNTLDQLGSRLEALASSQGAAIPNAAKLAELIPQEATILPGEPRKVCMTLPQLREFASAITGAPMAPHGTEEDAYVIERLGMLLAGVAVALKGPEKAMHRHGYEDLPELAAKLMLEVELHRALPPAAAGSALAATNAQLATIVQAAGVSLEPHIDTLPALKAAFVHIAYDNGMVDRAQPEPTVLNDMLQRVRLSFSSQQVEQVNAELAALTSEVLEQVCTEDLAALDPKPISDLADRLLNVAFDDEPPAIDYPDGSLVNDNFAIDWLTSGASLHPHTANLVVRFARALAAKLAAAEVKYGFSDGWRSPDTIEDCRARLEEHLAKGDPRDVAAYCAFLWHHGESTVAPALSSAPADSASRLSDMLSDPRPLHEQIAEVRRQERPSATVLNMVVGGPATTPRVTAQPARLALPEGWLIEREGHGVLSLHRAGTAQPTRYERGEVVHTLLSDLLGQCAECGGHMEHEDGEPWDGPSVGCVECGVHINTPRGAPAS